MDGPMMDGPDFFGPPFDDMDRRHPLPRGPPGGPGWRGLDMDDRPGGMPGGPFMGPGPRGMEGLGPGPEMDEMDRGRERDRPRSRERGDRPDRPDRERDRDRDRERGGRERGARRSRWASSPPPSQATSTSESKEAAPAASGSVPCSTPGESEPRPSEETVVASEDVSEARPATLSDQLSETIDTVPPQVAEPTRSSSDVEEGPTLSAVLERTLVDSMCGGVPNEEPAAPPVDVAPHSSGDPVDCTSSSNVEWLKPAHCREAIENGNSLVSESVSDERLENDNHGPPDIAQLGNGPVSNEVNNSVSSALSEEHSNQDHAAGAAENVV